MSTKERLSVSPQERSTNDRSFGDADDRSFQTQIGFLPTVLSGTPMTVLLGTPMTFFLLTNWFSTDRSFRDTDDRSFGDTLNHAPFKHPLPHRGAPAAAAEASPRVNTQNGVAIAGTRPASCSTHRGCSETLSQHLRGRGPTRSRRSAPPADRRGSHENSGPRRSAACGGAPAPKHRFVASERVSGSLFMHNS